VYFSADYSLRCYDSKWNFYAAYAGLWACAYVIAFPLYMFVKLWSFRNQASNPEKFLLGFLLEDYQPLMPCLMWEGTLHSLHTLHGTLYSLHTLRGTLSSPHTRQQLRWSGSYC
jgi:hypothetical protein